MTEQNSKGEIVAKKSGELTVFTSFEEDAGSGLENLTAEDLTIPRLKILQALSPEVNKHDGKYVEGSVAGNIFNTVTRELYDEETGVVIIPVAYKRLFLEWQPREIGGGLVKQHLEADILRETTKDERGGDVLPNGNYIQTSATHYGLSIDGDSYQQVMIPMAGTQLKKSRTWNSVMAGLKVKASNGNVFTPPSYSHKYQLKTKAESNDRGNWFGWDIQLLSVLGEDEMFLYESAKNFSSTISLEGEASVASEVPF